MDITTVEGVLASGLALGKIKVLLETLFSKEPKEIESLIEDAGIKGERSTNFLESFNNFLVSGDRTLEEVTDYINGVGEYEVTSANIKRHIKTYLKSYDLVKRVRARVIADFEEEKEA